MTETSKQVPFAAAGLKLGLTYHQIRTLVLTGKLDGGMNNGHWFVNAHALANFRHIPQDRTTMTNKHIVAIMAAIIFAREDSLYDEQEAAQNAIDLWIAVDDLYDTLKIDEPDPHALVRDDDSKIDSKVDKPKPHSKWKGEDWPPDDMEE